MRFWLITLPGILLFLLFFPGAWIGIVLIAFGFGVFAVGAKLGFTGHSPSRPVSQSHQSGNQDQFSPIQRTEAPARPFSDSSRLRPHITGHRHSPKGVITEGTYKGVPFDRDTTGQVTAYSEMGLRYVYADTNAFTEAVDGYVATHTPDQVQRMQAASQTALEAARREAT